MSVLVRLVILGKKNFNFALNSSFPNPCSDYMPNEELPGVESTQRLVYIVEVVNGQN